jgi:hypothetical protein
MSTDDHHKYINVSPLRGMHVKDIEIDPSTLVWTPCTLNMNVSKSYQVQWTFHNELGELLRPVNAIHNIEFENLFGFGCNCSGFTTNKVISITLN